jgi:hypothetical protein
MEVCKDRLATEDTMSLADHRDVDDTIAMDTLLRYSTIRSYPMDGLTDG